MPKASSGKKSEESWVFADEPSLGVLSLRRIVIDKSSSVLAVFRGPDGSWQFLDGGELSEDDAAVVGLKEMVDFDPTLVQLAALPPGWSAFREEVGGAWYVEPCEDDEEMDESEDEQP